MKMPKWLVAEIQPQPYPVEHLNILQAVVQEVQHKTQAPIEIVAQSTLVVASYTTQARCNVETLAGESPTSLFALTIACSGERKSTVDKLLSAPLVAHQQKMLATKNHNGLNPHFLLTDPTAEGLIKHMQTSHPSVVQMSDEGGIFCGGHAMNAKNRMKTISLYSKLWDGDSIINRTRAQESSFSISDKRMALHLMMQPEVSKSLLGDALCTKQGFLARFIIVQPRSTLGYRPLRDVSAMPDLAVFSRRIEALLACPVPMKEGTNNLCLPTLRLSVGAYKALSEFYDETEVGQRPDGVYADIIPHASKAPAQACRIAATLQVYSDENASEVSSVTMEDAIGLTRWYVQGDI